MKVLVQVVQRQGCSVMCNSSMASFRAIIIVTLANSTANGLDVHAEEVRGRDEAEHPLAGFGLGRDSRRCARRCGLPAASVRGRRCTGSCRSRRPGRARGSGASARGVRCRRLSVLSPPSICSRHGSTIVGPTIFMMSTGLVKWAPKAWRSAVSRRVLEERAEDFRPHLRPVRLGGLFGAGRVRRS